MIINSSQPPILSRRAASRPHRPDPTPDLDTASLEPRARSSILGAGFGLVLGAGYGALAGTGSAYPLAVALPCVISGAVGTVVGFELGSLLSSKLFADDERLAEAWSKPLGFACAAAIAGAGFGASLLGARGLSLLGPAAAAVVGAGLGTAVGSALGWGAGS